MEDTLRSECKNLLEQLKNSQFVMKASIPGRDKLSVSSKPQSLSHDPIQAYSQGSFGQELPCEVNVDADTDLKPSYARSKLSSLAGSRDLIHGVKDCYKDKENLAFSNKTYENNGKEMNVELANRLKDSKCVEREITETAGNLRHVGINDEDDDCVITSTSWQAATPGTQRRRQMIDRHTAVPTKLDTRELRDLNKERLLNFSYSHINVEDNIAGLDSGEQDVATQKDPVSDVVTKSLSTRQGVLAGSRLSRLGTEEKETFHQQLTDDGNNRRLNSFIKEATIKPKSILNSTAYYSLNNSRKNNSRVRFNHSQSLEIPDHRMLGYDWIAALLDNDPSLNNQSESFFDDIKDFRKAYKDECSNRFYMEGPYTLVDSEPAPVVEALAEPKVRPYVVNDRLFTEPFRPDLIDYEEDNDTAKKGSREPNKDNPRFVRVSIPRSTLQTPYRIKPHRRGSFDAADSCALMDHCLLGWENSRPVMLPSAHTIDLNTEAGTRVDSATTTLADAERQATLQSRTPWPRPTPRQQTLPNWCKQYMNTTLNLSLPPSTTQMSGGSRPADVKRATDKLLSSTYSTMYEMERLRQEREIERKMNEGGERRK